MKHALGAPSVRIKSQSGIKKAALKVAKARQKARGKEFEEHLDEQDGQSAECESEEAVALSSDETESAGDDGDANSGDGWAPSR